MSTLKSYRLLGLNLRDNRTSAAEETACAVADNVYARDPGELVTRPEVEAYGDTARPAVQSGVHTTQLASAWGEAVALRSDGDLYGLQDNVSRLSPVGTGTLAPRPRVANPPSSANIASSLLVAGEDAPAILDGPWSSLRPVGVPQPPLPKLYTAGSGTWLPPEGEVAYRTVLGLNTPDGRIVLSAPSGRATIKNGTIARSPYIEAHLPPGLRPELTYFMQVYRSASSTAGPADDEMGQVWESVVTPAQLAAGYVAIDDLVEDASRGVPLYSNERQEGGLETNDQPMRCDHVAAFADCAFYLGAYGRAEYTMEVLAGLAGGEVVTVSTYDADGALLRTFSMTGTNGGTVDPLLNFLVWTAGSVTQRAQGTAAELVRTINRNGYVGQDVFATFSTVGGLGGTLVVKAVGRAHSVTLTSTAAVASKFAPTLGSPMARDQENRPGRLYFSKPGLPEAVPPINYLDTRDSGRFLGAASTGNSLFLFRTDGVWRVTGTGPENFQVEPFESGYSLLGDGCFAVLGERAFCLSTAGVLMGGESGFRPISSPVDPLLQSLGDTWMAADQARQLLLFGFRSGTAARAILIYALRTGQWTTWGLPMRCGLGQPDGGTLLLASEEGYVHALRAADAASTGIDTLRTVDGTIVDRIPLAIEPLPLDAGDALRQKHFQEVAFALEETPGAAPEPVTITFLRDGVSEVGQAVALRSYATGAARTPVPRNYRRSGVLRVRFSALGLRSVRGLRVRLGDTSERTNR